MDIKAFRDQIDNVDKQLVDLFVQRMNLSAQIADYKKEHNMPIYVPVREREKLQDVAEKAGPELESFARELYITLFRLSREYQAVRNEEVIL